MAAHMDRKPPSAPAKAPIAGGALLALSLVVGSVIGVMRGQPSIGFVGGLGVGLLAIVAVALIDRARNR